MKSVYCAVRTGSLNTAVCAWPFKVLLCTDMLYCVYAYAEDKCSRSRNFRCFENVNDDVPCLVREFEYESYLTFCTGTGAVFVELVIVNSCVASLYKPIRSDVKAVPAKGKNIYTFT